MRAPQGHRLSILSFFILLLAIPTGAGAQALGQACNEAVTQEAKSYFLELRETYLRDKSQVDEWDFRAAAAEYILMAEQCYQAKNGAPLTGQMIDEGGVWLNTNANKHILFGTKWGAGSPFAGGTDVIGPRAPGGTVTYSFMPAGVSFASEGSPPPDTNTPITSLATFDPCMLEEISNAFGAWSAVSDISFVPVTDGGGAFNSEPTGDIRIGAHTFDGAGGILAHAFFPPPNGVFAAGDTHFDIAEVWTCDTTLGALDFGIVALHEFGHAIGLNHEATDLAVMNAAYNPSFTFGPLADDIIGAGEIYGEAGIAETAFFGRVGIGTDAPAAPLDVNIGTQTPGAGNAVMRLERVGAVGFQLKDSNDTRFWQFANAAGGSEFRISKSGTGGTEFNLTTTGDLTVRGDYFSATCTSPGSPCAPDYVFAEDYELMPLSQLAQFLETNRHLPNVPSEDDLRRAKKINMSTFQMTLLEKIEELTLYTLQQQETIEALSLATKRQQDQIEQLRAQPESQQPK